jgi:multidrug efflux system membrane fusion protein
MGLQRYRTASARNAIPKQTLDDPEQLVLQDQGTVQAPPASFSSRHH